MTTAQTQTYLAKILKNRINAEIDAGTLSTDTEISSILDAFVAGGKITMDQYNELNQLIESATTPKSSENTQS